MNLLTILRTFQLYMIRNVPNESIHPWRHATLKIIPNYQSFQNINLEQYNAFQKIYSRTFCMHNSEVSLKNASITSISLSIPHFTIVYANVYYFMKRATTLTHLRHKMTLKCNIASSTKVRLLQSLQNGDKPCSNQIRHFKTNFAESHTAFSNKSYQLA